MAKLPGLGEYFATVGAPAINFGRGLLGYQDPFTTQTMQDRMAELEAEKGPTGNIGYEDYGLKTATPGGRFTGGLMGLALNNPVDFGLAGSIGRYSYSPQGRTGLNYDFTPDQDTGSTGNAMLDFINAGGVKGALSKMGTAQAAEVTPPNTILGNFGTPGSIISDGPGKYEVNPDGKTASLIGRSYDMSDVAGLGDLGNPTGDSRVASEELGMTGRPTTGRPSMADIAGPINENLRDLGNPFNDSRIAPEERGLSGFPGLGQVDPGFQNVLDAREARRGQIEMQQNPDYGQFFDPAPLNEQKRGIDLGMLGMLAGPAGMFTGSNALRGIGLLSNIASGRAGRAASTISRGLGSLGSRISGSMRGINPVTGRPNTQAQYEQNRADRQAQNRTDSMIDRIANNRTTRSNPRDAGTTQAQKDAISAAIQDSHRGGGSGGSSSSKIVCTMMNERYGFGSFRNKIWMKFHEHHGPEYQKGYHAIFLPLVKIAKGEGKINTAVRKVLEHMGRHVTADMFKIMKGKKRDTLGRIYRAIFEPACHIIGKIKSALGRG